jgi:hypothetical protein
MFKFTKMTQAPFFLHHSPPFLISGGDQSRVEVKRKSGAGLRKAHHMVLELTFRVAGLQVG